MLEKRILDFKQNPDRWYRQAQIAIDGASPVIPIPVSPNSMNSVNIKQKKPGKQQVDVRMG